MPVEQHPGILHYDRTLQRYNRNHRKGGQEMTIQDFILEAGKEIRSYLEGCGEGDVQVSETDIVKANDTVLHGLILRREGSAAGANIYLDDLFERHESGERMTDLMWELKSRCRAVLESPLPPFELLNDLRLESIRSRLTLRLLDVRRNMSYMAHRPYIDAGNGLAMAVDINCHESIKSEWKVAVTDGVLESIGCSREELLTAAMENTIILEPPLLMDLPSYLATGSHDNYLEGLPREAGNGPFILTNTSQVRGAAVLFYPGIMERISDVFHGGYYVLPISIHEMLIIPEETHPDVAQLAEMLEQGNRVIVDEDDVLSDKVFRYCPASQKLCIAKAEAA